MGLRQFTREFKIEAVRLFRDRGVSVAEAVIVTNAAKPMVKIRAIFIIGFFPRL